MEDIRVAIIGIDSSGIVSQPPIYFVAVRLKHRHGKLDYNSQKHHIIKVNKEVHDSFINKAREWRWKLSATLIYYIMIPLLHKEDTVIIDVDFNPANRKIIKRYITKLLFTYHRETPIQQCPIEFRSVKEEECIKIADLKTKYARRGFINPIENVIQASLNEYFDILSKIS